MQLAHGDEANDGVLQHERCLRLRGSQVRQTAQRQHLPKLTVRSFEQASLLSWMWLRVQVMGQQHVLDRMLTPVCNLSASFSRVEARSETAYVRCMGTHLHGRLSRLK